jgi:3-phosphoshikimate 1-carboxyvinyltransferase
VPGLIDEIPILAVAATQAEGITTISGASELRVKESDRIATVASGLRALGADVEESPDGLRIAGPVQLAGGEVESQGDHRIAMAFAIAALVARDNVRVKGWSSVNTSFPEFLDVLATAQGRA